MKSNHPAVVAHYNNVVLRLGTKYPATPEEILEEKDNIPSHDDLVPYLEQLPRDCGYRILDPEMRSAVPDPDVKLLEKLQDGDGDFGLVVEFKAVATNPDGSKVALNPGDFNWDAFGGCQMLLTPDGLKGLRIYVNGCEAQSAPTYYVIPE